MVTRHPDALVDLAGVGDFEHLQAAQPEVRRAHVIGWVEVAQHVIDVDRREAVPLVLGEMVRKHAVRERWVQHSKVHRRYFGLMHVLSWFLDVSTTLNKQHNRCTAVVTHTKGCSIVQNTSVHRYKGSGFPKSELGFRCFTYDNTWYTVETVGWRGVGRVLHMQDASMAKGPSDEGNPLLTWQR